MKSQQVGIITKPIGKAGVIPLSNLVEIISSIASLTYVITGGDGMSLTREYTNKVFFSEVPYKYRNNLCIRYINHLLMQIRISLKIIRLKNIIDIWIFILDSHALLLPVLTAKLIGKKIVFALSASITKSDSAHRDAANKIVIYSEAINNRLADRIVLYSSNLVTDWSLEKYKNKILIARHHFLDFVKFKKNKQLNDRKHLVGYVGRLSEEKGIQNFVKAIPDILKEMNELNFLIGGDGQLRGLIEKDLTKHDLNEKVKLVGWISHDDLSQTFNQLKLLIIPSYSEGLPNIMLEAMACGTPILATPVGSIPDFINDGITGFIMENNSPEIIAKNILRALCHPKLEQIANNGRALVEKEFTFEKAVESYGEVLDSCGT